MCGVLLDVSANWGSVECCFSSMKSWCYSSEWLSNLRRKLCGTASGK